MAKTWRERLAEPITDEIVQLAARWDTCAVGEQQARHPEVVRFIEQPPLDYNVFRQRIESVTVEPWPEDLTLRALGTDFYLYLCRRDPAAAGRMLDAIEDRVLVLKRGEESPA